MEIKQELITMLQMLPQPAFLVRDGIVRHVNAASGVYLIRENLPVAQLLDAAAAEDYASFTCGSMYFALCLAEKRIGTVVTALEDCHLFSVEQPAEQAQLQGMALAAQQLRGPLAAMIAASDAFLPAAQDRHPKETAQFYQRMHQMLRRINNMSDAQQYATADSYWPECTEIVSFLKDILEKAAVLAEKGGYLICYSLPDAPISTLFDREKLERSVLNLLSNAMKFSPQGSEIFVQLMCRGNRICICVNGNGAPLTGNIYTRFCRQPMLEDPAAGIGLGMALVRATALMHGGAVLTDQPDDEHNRVTLALPIRKPDSTMLRTPVMQMDYAGGYDHCLLELSDVLPPELYQGEF